MPGNRQGGKQKQLKKPKKQQVELDDSDIEFKKKQQLEQQKLKEMQKRASKKGGLVKK